MECLKERKTRDNMVTPWHLLTVTVTGTVNIHKSPPHRLGDFSASATSSAASAFSANFSVYAIISKNNLGIRSIKYFDSGISFVIEIFQSRLDSLEQRRGRP